MCDFIGSFTKISFLNKQTRYYYTINVLSVTVTLFVSKVNNERWTKICKFSEQI